MSKGTECMRLSSCWLCRERSRECELRRPARSECLILFLVETNKGNVKMSPLLLPQMLSKSPILNRDLGGSGLV